MIELRYRPAQLAGLGVKPLPSPPKLPTLPTGRPMGAPLTGAELEALITIAAEWEIATGKSATSGATADEFELFLGEHYPKLITAVYRSEGMEWSQDEGAVIGPPTPEEMWAKFDAPKTGGPWALDAHGRWFEFRPARALAGVPGLGSWASMMRELAERKRAATAPRAPVSVPAKAAPVAASSASPAPGVPAGAKVLRIDGRLIYVPAEHPRVRIAESQYGAGDAHLKRWTDQKFRAANAAMLSGEPFENLFFNVAPRGGWGEGIGAGRAFEGTPEDYDFEGGNLYPRLKGGALAQKLADWYGKNNFDRRWGYSRGLTLNWLRVYTDDDGYRRYKPWSRAEATEFARRWFLSDHGYVCTPEEIEDTINDTMGRQAERQAAQSEGAYSVHWAWPIGPLSQCSVPSKRRRAENIRKIALVGAVIAGAIFLGPMIAGFFKAVAGKVVGVIKAIGGKIKDAVAKVKDSILTRREEAAQREEAARRAKEEAARAEAEAQAEAERAKKAQRKAKARRAEEEAARAAAEERAAIERAAAARAKKEAAARAEAAAAADRIASEYAQEETVGPIPCGPCPPGMMCILPECTPEQLAENAGISTGELESLLTNVIGAVNAARTVEAIKNGAVPPPPISVEGESFREWATSVAMTYAESEMAEELSELEQQQLESELRHEIELMQRQVHAQAAASPAPIILTSDPSVSPAVQRIQEAEAFAAAREGDMTKTVLLAGGALLAVSTVARR